MQKCHFYQLFFRIHFEGRPMLILCRHQFQMSIGLSNISEKIICPGRYYYPWLALHLAWSERCCREWCVCLRRKWNSSSWQQPHLGWKRSRTLGQELHVCLWICQPSRHIWLPVYRKETKPHMWSIWLGWKLNRLLGEGGRPVGPFYFDILGQNKHFWKKFK